MAAPDALTRRLLTPRLVLGLAVIALGVVLTLDNLDLLEAADLLRYWPLALIALGLSRLASGGATAWLWASLWIGLGSWLLLDNLGYIGVDPWRYAGPLALVLIGTSLLWGGLRRGGAPPDAGDEVSAFALMSGCERKSTATAFRGGDLTALMGGCELDLRGAHLAPGGALVHVFAFWGGIGVRVPPDWWVDARPIALLGACEDRTRQQPARGGPRLTVRGWVIMGGVELKN